MAKDMEGKEKKRTDTEVACANLANLVFWGDQYGAKDWDFEELKLS
ncbi:uncharacterized protein G2W53_038737 [Senna tora]|uniref:Uncharacterized protein n=1 Tax=Senna tora TaxID=362788 RepID=A0A834SNU2_9FABA|nr:uncharacterized protein G2W53_038737 [Senna tora]